MRKAASEMIASYAHLAEVPRATGKRRVSLVVSGWDRGGRFPDKDAFDKLFLDALSRSGQIVDDSQDFLEGRVEVVFVRGSVMTTIILEDV